MSCSATDWLSATEAGDLLPDDIHLWAVALGKPGDAARWSAILTTDERQRADRFRVAKARERFVASRSALRQILSLYVEMAPDEIRFVYDDLGKPALDPQAHSERVGFNLSHSGDLAVLAVARDHEIGVDVEQLRKLRHPSGIAKRFFHPAEAEEVLSWPPKDLQRAFFHCWTRKEAVIKALGAGLRFPLDGYRVPVNEDRACWIEYPASAYNPAGRCWLQAFQPCPGYVGAVASFVEARIAQRRTLSR